MLNNSVFTQLYLFLYVHMCLFSSFHPLFRLVIRIRCDAADAQAPLGMKFGVLPEDAGALLAAAQDLDLDIVGVSFHVGSGCRESAVFYRAIAAAKNVSLLFLFWLMEMNSLSKVITLHYIFCV